MKGLIMKKLYKDDPRSYATELVLDEYVDAGTMVTACLKFMSSDDVRAMLDDNELSPRFFIFIKHEEVLA
jgi:hypothetical protein|tara:strand:+ start:122 stop:331 length:210 start_codon:yes stop_codon:yes gene_type:complete